MRDAFSNTLVNIAKGDPSVILLTGDHGYALFDDFRRECSGQYINAGIAEQNMVGMAAGLAKSGFRPVIYGLSAFIPVRVLEQIKLDIAHDSLPVILIGDGAGLVYSHLGTSHQSTEDIACTRAIPNLAIYSPCDRFELQATLLKAYSSLKPSYIRIGKSDRGDLHDAEIQNLSNEPLKIYESRESKTIIFATGSMVKTAIEMINEGLISASVWSVPVIKPINIKSIIDICANNRFIITMEEHSKFGGLGSLIAEIISQVNPTKILIIGVNDVFSCFCGTYEYLLSEHNLDKKSIKDQIDAFIRIC